MKEDEIKKYLTELNTVPSSSESHFQNKGNWQVLPVGISHTEGIIVRNNLKLHKEFKFNSFKEALDFTNKVAEIAEEEQHHPNILINYNKVEIDIWTHKIDGLHENDFILASKIDSL